MDFLVLFHVNGVPLMVNKNPLVYCIAWKQRTQSESEYDKTPFLYSSFRNLIPLFGIDDMNRIILFIIFI